MQFLDPGVFTHRHFLKIVTNQNLDCTIITSNLWTFSYNGKSLFILHLEGAPPFRVSKQAPLISLMLEYCGRQMCKSRAICPHGKNMNQRIHIRQKHWKIVVVYISAVKLRLQTPNSLLLFSSPRNATRFKNGRRDLFTHPFQGPIFI